MEVRCFDGEGPIHAFIFEPKDRIKSEYPDLEAEAAKSEGSTEISFPSDLVKLGHKLASLRETKRMVYVTRFNRTILAPGAKRNEPPPSTLLREELRCHKGGSRLVCAAASPVRYVFRSSGPPGWCD